MRWSFLGTCACGRCLDDDGDALCVHGQKRAWCLRSRRGNRRTRLHCDLSIFPPGPVSHHSGPRHLTPTQRGHCEPAQPLQVLRDVSCLGCLQCPVVLVSEPVIVSRRPLCSHVRTYSSQTWARATRRLGAPCRACRVVKSASYWNLCTRSGPLQLRNTTEPLYVPVFSEPRGCSQWDRSACMAIYQVSLWRARLSGCSMCTGETPPAVRGLWI